MMKKMIRTGLLAMALFGASCGIANAYMYGIDENYNPTGYPVQLFENVNLCYTWMGGGHYMEEKSAKIISEEGDVYVISADFINYNKERGALVPKKGITYKFDTSTHTVYFTTDSGEEHAIAPRSEDTAQVEYRAMSEAKQMWHAVMGTDWDW